MPELQRDIQAASKIMATFLSIGGLVDRVTLEEIVRDRPPCTPTEH
jgi:hypothetical protein